MLDEVRQNDGRGVEEKKGKRFYAQPVSEPDAMYHEG